MFAPGSVGYRHLFGVAYRVLGSVHDAEDAVQEGFARWQALTPAERDAVREPLAWLTRVVGRVCLDVLGSARSRREAGAGIWLPEPLIGSVGAVAHGSAAPVDPADAVSMDESVTLALLVAMEQLTPAERVSLILHDVFGVPFAEVAEVVARTPEACRQLATSARRRLRSGPRETVAGPARDAVVTAFARACAAGDLEGLVAVLDPDVVSRADGGVHIRAARRPVVGAAAVAQYLLGVTARQQRHSADLRPSVEPVNGRTGVVVRDRDAVVAVVDLAVGDDGRIREIAMVVDPDKLTQTEA
ncbi:RNA polymerase sigma factor SigJ [Cellulomonas sp. ATA003]|uniref:RNA polymerase sigma factor SigJ n=1 Tax=Cellulomonas sp. ATA003 TaxID=3073064 RepID=UPI002872D66F|nr:RNA polymerase sigma factor SigJ [Cellulomonas sp. ATA003]WNB86563.1 RNA polymerase sigma factor SigJ [Cellulomonas sp. ATA003]